MQFIAEINITYDDIFDDYENVDIRNLISNIPSKNIVEIIGHYSAQLHINKNNHQLRYLGDWGARLPKPVQQKYKDLSQNTNMKLM